ncbi:MAG TPA: NDP-hexose 2,3-dehydratase family protein, partial [Patescibacteria group bacterium]|nr:NDP-hexose 2,3-dehydratase family protein [Patescibacteria group bacterium]
SGREVTFWYSPMIMGEAEGLILLIVNNANGDVLIRAKSEPGNVGVVLDDGSPTRLLFSPPFQASQSNMAAHGNRVPLVELARSVQDWEDGPEDGGRFYEKVSKYSLLMADAEVVASQIAMSPNPEDFIWVTRRNLRELRRRGMVNGYLRSAMATLA